MLPDLTLSIISADNIDQLRPCLDSIFATTTNTTLDIIVVDNASEDDTYDAILRDFPRVQVLRNATRLGFSTNNNMVLSQGRGRYLMLLNDDTLVTNGALDQLVSFMDSHDDAAVVGAYLLNADGSPQSSYAYFPRPVTEAIWPVTNWAHYFSGKSTEPFQVDSVCGAALLVRREILDNVGLLDADYDPIYSEEVDWCFRIKANGGKIYMHPGARIIHYGSQTMDQVVPQKYELLLAHKHLFFRKHYGVRSAAIYKTTLLVATAFKYLWWLLADVLRPKNESRLPRAELHKYLLTRISRYS